MSRLGGGHLRGDGEVGWKTAARACCTRRSPRRCGDVSRCGGGAGSSRSPRGLCTTGAQDDGPGAVGAGEKRQRQPVPLTTRFYSRSKDISFNDTSEEQRRGFVAGKVYWLSGVLGAGGPVWLVDPRDAQYLNTRWRSCEAVGIAGDGGVAAGDGPGVRGCDGEANGAAGGVCCAVGADGWVHPAIVNEEMRHGLTNM